MTRYPTEAGATALKEAQGSVTPAQLLGHQVILMSRRGFVYNGTLEEVSDEGDLTVSVKVDTTFKKFRVTAADVKSCRKPFFDGKKP